MLSLEVNPGALWQSNLFKLRFHSFHNNISSFFFVAFWFFICVDSVAAQLPARAFALSCTAWCLYVKWSGSAIAPPSAGITSVYGWLQLAWYLFSKPRLNRIVFPYLKSHYSSCTTKCVFLLLNILSWPQLVYQQTCSSMLTVISCAPKHKIVWNN